MVGGGFWCEYFRIKMIVVLVDSLAGKCNFMRFEGVVGL